MMKRQISSSPTREECALDSHPRKRVCKACDRCRLKKCKCDGESPCSRCRLNNSICCYGERKRAHERIYPSGYVEMLEEQQGRLVYALQKLYQHISRGEGWPGESLRCEENGPPLTHDLLSHLGALEQPQHEQLRSKAEITPDTGCMSSPNTVNTRIESAQSMIASPAVPDAFPGTYSLTLPTTGFSPQQRSGLKTENQETEDPFDYFAPWTSEQNGEYLPSWQDSQQWSDNFGPFNNMDSLLEINWINMPLDDPFASLIPII